MYSSTSFSVPIQQLPTTSPFLKPTPSTAKPSSGNLPFSQLTTQHQTSINSKKASRTEEQIYSHELISNVMSRRVNNTVMHNIGQLDKEIQLYAKPMNPEQYNLLEFSDQRQVYQSEYTKKIIDINRKLNKGQSLSERVKNRKEQNSDTFYRTKRPTSASTQPQTHKKISVSGLVSYNFNSINARKTLGFDFQRDQDKLNSILQKLQTRNKCCTFRQHSLIQKKKQQKALKETQVRQAIFSDFTTYTSNFLNNLHEELNEQQTVYGYPLAKLLCIKELMAQEKIPYAEAEAIVNQIQEKKLLVKKQKPKVNRNDEAEFQARKQPQQRGKVMLKHLYFAD